jgi:Tol biopolymer transport system component
MRVRTIWAVAVVCVAGSASPAIAGEHGTIVFDSLRAGGEEPDIWTMSAKGRNPINLTPGSPAFDGLADWRPDGRKIAFISDRAAPGNPVLPGQASPDREVFLMNADGSNLTQVTFNELSDDDVAFSPDGRSLLVRRDLDPVHGQDAPDLIAIKVDSGRERNLTNSPDIDEVDPEWSPDGNRIAFTSDRDGDGEIYTMKVDGSRVRQVTTNTVGDESPSWSPDGRTLAFMSDRDPVDDTGFAWDIYTMRPDGDRQTRLTVGGLDDFAPRWSPDGRAILFATFRHATLGGGELNAEIYTMRPDGSKPSRLTQNLAFDGFPDWRP